MKAQAGIEFITSYGWALLAIIVFLIFVFYFISTLQQTPAECNFGMEFPCTSYHFFKNSAGEMRLVLKLTNGLGRDIVLYNKSQVLTVENVGKSGVNNYTGNCTGPADIVKTGDVILCMFDIKDKAVVPSVGKSTKFTVMLNYTNCGVGAFFCFDGTNRTSYGKVVTNLELMPANVPAYCMDGKCDAGENYTNCGWDCPPPRPKYIDISTQPIHGKIDFNITDPVNVTVFVSSRASPPYVPIPDIPVLIYLTGYDECPNCASPECLSYSINPNPVVTNASGYAFSQVQINWCSPSCGISNLYLIYINAAAGDVIDNTPFYFPVSTNCK